MVSNWDSKEIRENDFGFWKSNFGPQNSKSKSNFKFWGADFLILEVDFQFCIPKIQNRNRIKFQVLKSRFLIFPNPNFLKWSKFQILVSAFSSHFDPNFQFLGSISQNFLRISLHTRKFCSPHFSSTYALPGNHHPANTYASSTPEAYSRGSRSSVRLNIKIINYRYLI